MTIERGLRLIAGCMVLLSRVMNYNHSAFCTHNSALIIQGADRPCIILGGMCRI